MTAFKAASLLLVAGCAWLILSALTATPRVSIQNPGRFASAPADWWILVTVDQRPDHRALIVEADGHPGEYRRSDLSLEGEKAPRLRQVWFKALSAGCYWFVASVTDTSHVLGTATSGPVSIIGRDGESCPAS